MPLTLLTLRMKLFIAASLGMGVLSGLINHMVFQHRSGQRGWGLTAPYAHDVAVEGHCTGYYCYAFDASMAIACSSMTMAIGVLNTPQSETIHTPLHQLPSRKPLAFRPESPISL